jgi:hypothetical protein
MAGAVYVLLSMFFCLCSNVYVLFWMAQGVPPRNDGAMRNAGAVAPFVTES